MAKAGRTKTKTTAAKKFVTVKASSGPIVMRRGTASEIRASLKLKPAREYKIHSLLKAAHP